MRENKEDPLVDYQDAVGHTSQGLENQQPVNHKVTEGVVCQLVIGLQISRVDPKHQLQVLRDYRLIGIEMDPSAVDYLDRQIQALEDFCK